MTRAASRRALMLSTSITAAMPRTPGLISRRVARQSARRRESPSADGRDAEAALAAATFIAPLIPVARLFAARASSPVYIADRAEAMLGRGWRVASPTPPCRDVYLAHFASAQVRREASVHSMMADEMGRRHEAASQTLPTHFEPIHAPITDAIEARFSYRTPMMIRPPPIDAELVGRAAKSSLAAARSVLKYVGRIIFTTFFRLTR